MRNIITTFKRLTCVLIATFLIGISLQANAWEVEYVEGGVDSAAGLDSSIAIDSNNQVHLSYSYITAEPNWRIKYRMKGADGRWTVPIFVTPLEQSAYPLHSFAIGGSAAYLTFRDMVLGHLYSVSGGVEDTGISWGSPAELDGDGNVGIDPQTIADSRGRFHTIYFDYTNNRIKHAVFGSAGSPVSIDIVYNYVITPDETGIMPFNKLTRFYVGPIEDIMTMFHSMEDVPGGPSAEKIYTATKTYIPEEYLEGLSEEEREQIAMLTDDWVVDPIIPGDIFRELHTGRRFGQRFDVAAGENILAGIHYCFYDRDTGYLKYARMDSSGGGIVLDVAGPSGTTGTTGDTCSIAVCGNKVHIIAMRNYDYIFLRDKHKYLSYTRAYDAERDVPWENHQITKGIELLDDDMTYISSACDGRGGLHVAFPVRVLPASIHLAYAYLPPPSEISCGDLYCNGDETIATCPSDCAGTCGDGTCHRLEHAITCPADCRCGNGTCDWYEDIEVCPADCGGDGGGEHVPVCGNGVIETGEECDDGNMANNDGCNKLCLTEPGGPACGNGVLEAGAGEACDDGNRTSGDGCDENCQKESVCGDGVCSDDETPDTCAPDCLTVTPRPPVEPPVVGEVCGDGVCGNGETVDTCALDCSVGTRIGPPTSAAGSKGGCSLLKSRGKK